MKYNRTRIENLDPRQCEYVKMHTENYGTDRLVINGKTYAERCEELRPSEEDIKAVLANYPDREAFLWNNMRGWTVVFKTKINEKMFRWNQMEKIQ